jgi:MoaA/NifB/PqqE/SkfB family radical SAM enzyme
MGHQPDAMRTNIEDKDAEGIIEEIFDRPRQLKELKLEVTHRCYLNCIHCSSEASPDECWQMTLVDAIRIVREAVGMGVPTIAISGGEPATWEGIIPLIKIIAQSHMKLSLYSSGIGDQVSNIIESMRSIPGARLVFSMFSHRPEPHERITQTQGSHRTTIESIKLAVKLGIRTEIHFTAMRFN